MHSVLKTPGGFAAYVGGNQSGRSTSLMKRVEISQGSCVGPKVSSFITGIAPTVADEIRLHCGGREDVWKQVQELCELFDLTKEFGKNPFRKQLSGGQETLVAIFSKISLNRKYVGLDTCVEQLSRTNRAALYNVVFSRTDLPDIEVVDNRLDEIYGEDYMGVRAGATFLPDCSLRRKQHSGTLSLEGIHFKYPTGDMVLRDLSFSFSPGIHRLRGQNGTGKSTAAKLIIGLLKPLRGKIRFLGREIIPFLQPGAFACMAFQDPAVQFAERSVQQTVEASAWTRELVEAFGLKPYLNEHPLDLPWTMQKRLSILITLARETPISILDEPTIGQDSLFCDLLAYILYQLGKTGAIVIVITHSEKFAAKLGARELSLDKRL